MPKKLVDEILEKAERILETYPLCDHCLGRIYARLGMGLGNDERGRAIKTLLAMTNHFHAKENPEEARYRLRKLAENAGGPLAALYEKLYGEDISTKQCYVCGGKLSRRYFEELAKKAAEIIKTYNPSNFLIGVSITPAVRARETQVLALAGIEYSESIKNEVKREVGKLVSALTGLPPGFEKPDITIIIDLETGLMTPIVAPVLLKGVYWKKARNISHTIWATRDGRRYPYSLEEFFTEKLVPIFEAERIVLHAAGREDVDARMLGTGRPVVVEVKVPKKRHIDREALNKALASDVVEAVITGEASRNTIRLYKTGATGKSKIYKALVYVDRELSKQDLLRLEEEMHERVIRQLTPKRILGRKKETLRIRRVYSVKTRMIGKKVFEALIHSSGGLYIKELINSDEGRTEPSFSSILGAKAECIELDVVYVEPYTEDAAGNNI